MSDSVSMPALGESVTEGTVTRWLKQVGDRVEVDEPLLEVSTDKVDTEIPSPFAGTLQEILVAEDETVEVGAQLAVIGEGQAADGGSTDGGSTDGGQAAPEDQPADASPEQPPSEQPSDQPSEQSVEQPSEQAADEAPGDPDQQPDAASQPDAGGTDGDASSSDGTPIVMPALGESVSEGTVTRWLKSEGDTVQVDEPLLEVSTDKVDTEIPSPVAGTVQRILVAEDETVAVGAQLAIVATGAAGAGQAGSQPQADEEPPAAEQQAPEPAPEPQPESAEQNRQPEPVAQDQQPEQAAPPPTPPAGAPSPQAPSRTDDAAERGSGSGQQSGDEPDGAGYVTLVRRMATEHGIDLATLTGTGVGGRIRKQDVIDAAKAKEAEQAKQADQQPSRSEPAAQAQPAPAGSAQAAAKPVEVSAKRGTTEKMTRLRKVIAERMVASLQTSAQLTTVIEVDVTRIAQLRNRAKNEFAAREGVRLSFLPFFALATVEALKQHPKLNASIEGDQIVYHPQENLGVAVDTERGLLVPTIRDAGDLNIAGLARKINDLADRTRNNKVSPDELGGGTFTLTNTGSRGALFDTPILFQPQVGILGTGAVVKRPVVVTDEYGSESIAIRSLMYLALSYDHRLVDGADAARFLVTVKERLEEGAFDADLGL